MNQHFATKSTVPGPDDPVPHLEQKLFPSHFDSLNTSPLQVAKKIRSTLKQSHKSHCGIPGNFFPLISTPISFSLSRLLNNHFEKGIFPDIWKLSHITAIWKHKGLKSDKANYCPISLLPTLSKICEAIIHFDLLRHCQENQVISSKQAA